MPPCARSPRPCDAQALDPAPSAIPAEPRSATEAFERYFHEVARGLQRLGVRDGDVDDATQEVFLVVHRRWDEFERRSSLRTWIWGITLHVARRHRQRWRGWLRRHVPWPSGGSELPAGDPGPYRELESRRAARQLQELLAHLDARQREVFTCVALEQLSVAEAARLLDIPVTTAHARHRKACRLLERHWKRRELARRIPR